MIIIRWYGINFTKIIFIWLIVFYRNKIPGVDCIVIKLLVFMQYLYIKIIDDIIMISFWYHGSQKEIGKK